MILIELTIQLLRRAKKLRMSLSDYQLAMMVKLGDLNEVRLLALDYLAANIRR